MLPCQEGGGGVELSMILYEPSSITSENLPQTAGISGRLRSLLYARGAKTPEEMEQFLHPGEGQFCDPYDFKDMDIAAERIRSAIGRERICVFGDYDADGVSATAILTDCRRSIGADVIYRMPSRHEEGYGLSICAVERLKEEGVDIIVTVDNGIKAYGEIDRCRELGMDVVVTDHHRCDGRIPECCAVICHTREDNTYPNKDLCGAGIAWKLAEALVGREQARKYLPIAGIATMADVVPLLGENRAIVALGLNMINAGDCCVGIKALGRAVNEKNDGFAARDLSFGFAPRLNAAGRIEDASICVELLCTADANRADEIAQRLDELNRLRQKEETAIVDKAAAMVKKLRENDLDFNDMLDQMTQMKKMGSLSKIIDMLPGAKVTDEDAERGEKQLRQAESIIRSMTPAERAKPSLINPSRKRRIAAGSGTRVEDVNRLLRQLEQSKKMIKQMSSMKKRGRGKMPFGGMPGM